MSCTPVAAFGADASSREAHVSWAGVDTVCPSSPAAGSHGALSLHLAAWLALYTPGRGFRRSEGLKAVITATEQFDHPGDDEAGLPRHLPQDESQAPAALRGRVRRVWRKQQHRREQWTDMSLHLTSPADRKHDAVASIPASNASQSSVSGFRGQASNF